MQHIRLHMYERYFVRGNLDHIYLKSTVPMLLILRECRLAGDFAIGITYDCSGAPPRVSGNWRELFKAGGAW